jgi:hypothetical protein
MRKFTVGLVSGLVALAGFAGSASASATIDLIWVVSGTDTTSNVVVSGNITLNVVLTAGANGSLGAAVSVDYAALALIPDFSIVTFASVTSGFLPITVGSPSDSGTQINNLNATGFAAMPEGQSAVIGTVTFHDTTGTPGTFQVDAGTFSVTDAVLDGFGGDISETTTFNSAFVPEPSQWLLLGAGMIFLVVLYRRRRAQELRLA